jgi:hypothetical protein
MDYQTKMRFEAMRNAPLTWDPTRGGKKAFVCFNDSVTVDISDPFDLAAFDQIADRMMAGSYYPPDAVEFFGEYQDKGRNICVGDRILQRAPLIAGLHAWSMVEIYAAERKETFCQIGYVTTKCHHGKGIWTATLHEKEGRLELLVESVASPRSFLFWTGLPFARFLQLRTRRRAIEEFLKVSNLLSQVSKK